MNRWYRQFLLFCEAHPKFVLFLSLALGLLFIYLEVQYELFYPLAAQFGFWVFCFFRFFLGILQLLWVLGPPLPIPLLEFFDNLWQFLGLPSLEEPWHRFKNFLAAGWQLLLDFFRGKK